MEQIEEEICRLKISLPDLAQNLLHRALNVYERHEFEEKIFKKILPHLGASLSKIVESPVGDCTTEENTTAEKTLADAKSNLLRCEQLLNLCQICLNRIVDDGQIRANGVRSLLDTLIEGIKLCFQQCKSSESAYGRYLFGRLTSELGTLFRTANTILRRLLTTLEEDVIVFDTDVQSETELLAKVVSAIGTIAVIVNGMDLKTFVEMLKSFGRLALKHHRSIRRVSPESVNVHIGSLAESACLVLSGIEEPDKRVGERTLRSVNLTVKVLEKLIALYGSSATTETFYSLLGLLVRIYRCSMSCSGISKIDVGTNVIVDNSMATAGAEHLLSKAFDANVFQLKKAFFDYGSQVDVDKLAYHTLTLAIMRKLSAAYHREWTVDSNSIIDVAFANINCLHEELCCGEVRIPFAYGLGEELRPIGIYEVTLILICRLIAKVSPSDLRTAELCLIKYTLSGQFWGALLSLDVWSFVGRLAPTELREIYVKYFMKIYATFEKEADRVEAVVIGDLIERLYSLLPNDSRHAVVEHLQRVDLHSWIPTLRYLPEETRLLLRDRLLAFDEISTAFARLQEKNDSRYWTYLTRLLRAAGKLRCNADDKVVEVSSKMRNLLANTIESYDERQVHASAEMISVLLNVSRAAVPCDEMFLSMLHGAIAMFPFVPSHVVVRIAFQMRDDVNSFNDCSPEVADALAKLSYNVLDEKKPIVFQEGLESFDEIVNVCPDENLIRKMASAVTTKPPWVSQVIRAYMSKWQCCELQGYSSVSAYIRHLVSGSNYSAAHVCDDYNDYHKDEKYPRIEENPKFVGEITSSDINQRVDRICDQLNELTKRKSGITADALRKLTVALSKLTD